MIGQIIEWLKHPKNAVSWFITGYILAVGGYILWHKYEDAGRIVGFIGALVIALTLLRLSLTHIAVGVVIVAAVVVYGWWYSKSVTIQETQESPVVFEHMPWKRYTSTRKRPKFAESGMGQRTQEAVFAPAFMFENVVRFPQWRTKIEESSNPDYNAPKI